MNPCKIFQLLSFIFGFLGVVIGFFVLPGNDSTRFQRRRRWNKDDLENAQELLRGFLRLSADIPLTPKRRSNFPSGPINYKVIDRTEYTINKRILNDVFETDLVLTTPQMRDVISDFQRHKMGQTRRKRKVIVGDTFRWPQQIVPYFLKETDREWRRIILDGMRKWERETCIHFKERTDEKDYVCYSSVGRIGGKQYTSIGYGCESGGIVAHELGHTLGFWHEQSRPDRDEYININEEHIFPGTKGNFEKRNDIAITDVPYDFGSVMHYGPQAFSNDYHYVTIETKDHRFQHTIGQRNDLSFIDIKEANRMYCKDKCKVNLNCLNGGYEDPRNCAICKCPPGSAGIRCESIPLSTGKLNIVSIAGCGGELLAGEQWLTLKSNIAGNCYWRITAPFGKVHLEVLDAMYVCDSSCADNYLEIKHGTKLEQTGFRQCCNAAAGDIISETNQVYIMSIALKAPANFTLRYIRDSTSSPLPKAPPAQWSGQGGITGLIGAENGIDNTWEHIVLKQLPRTLQTFGRPSHNIFSDISHILQIFLNPR
uniref:Metalloendopeptidase n=1 Tax=Onchocerca volvulus TaxID=6282 RepID=A0A8R1XVB5_ONCVO